MSLLRLLQSPWRQPLLPATPSYAAPLFRLAHIAVGDADTAAVMVADVVALEPPDERAALRLLLQRLPAGWLSWPGAAGPAEWLRLHLRREQADRVLSVLGEWDPDARIALGLWLLWDVRRDDVDSWMGTQGMDERIAEFVAYMGEGVDLVPLPGDQPSCEEFRAELIDAHERTVGRLVRLHILGCGPCRRRGAGLRDTADLLRLALDAFFRAPFPADFPRLVAIRQRQMRRSPSEILKPALVAVVLLLLYFGVIRKPDVTAAPAPPPATAVELLDRALNRFDAAALGQGVLHERIRVTTDGEPLIIERWFDYAGGHQMRLTAGHAGSGPPLLDLATDGAEQLVYEINADGAPSQHVVVRDKLVRQIAPLLRQLPATGGVGDTLVPQTHLDLTLLGTARSGRPSLLGATSWHGRPAFALVSVTGKHERLLLTIDRATYTLLEARTALDLGVASAPERIWQAETLEILTRREVPTGTFQLGVRATQVPLADPRQLELRPLGTLAVEQVTRLELPLPEHLPEPPVLAYLRSGRSGSGVVQIYEGRWSTLLVTAPQLAVPELTGQLDQHFAGGRFREIAHKQPNTTIVEFALEGAPNDRMRLYFWHAFAAADERAAIVRSVLDGMVLLDATNAARFAERFTARPSAVPGGFSTALRATVTPVSSTPERQFYRFKAAQAQERLDQGAPQIDPLLP